MVFYRKYRPQKIEDLDSKSVRDRLYSILESSSAPHAYLFTGPKGLGKTSTARIVAKALNCEKNSKLKSQKSKLQLKTQNLDAKDQRPKTLDQIEPCNECYQCRSITNGTNLDILEIDGASNRGIDEIRDLREKVKLSPLNARKKVYIIDEVHMLTTEAFNALLKTLEEPPSHVVFILCTTESHKVPGTILSRCAHIQFKKATQEELVRSFERIVKAEGINADKQALSLIAGLSDGSFRDGSKILEEMVFASKDKTITKELVEQKYQIASMQYQIAQMIRSLENKDAKSALESVAKLTSEGIEMGYFMQSLIETLHNNLLFKAGIDLKEISGFRIENSKMEIGEIKRLIELLSKAHGELKYSVLPQIPLELAIVEWSLPVGGPATTFPPASAPSISEEKSSAGSVRAVGSPSSRVTPNLKPTSSPISSPKIIQQDISKYSENDALWNALIDKIKTYNHSVAGVLRGCRIKSYDGKILEIETNFKFHKDKLSERKTQEILEEACREVTKKNVKIEVTLKEK